MLVYQPEFSRKIEITIYIWASPVAQQERILCNAGDVETQVQSLGQKYFLKKKIYFLEEVMATHSSNLAGKFHG